MENYFDMAKDIARLHMKGLDSGYKKGYEKGYKEGFEKGQQEMCEHDGEVERNTCLGCGKEL